MKIQLVCPFRTLLNVNSEVALNYAGHLENVLRRTAVQLTEKTGIEFITNKLEPIETAFTKYTNLDADHKTWFSTPLLEARLSHRKIEEIEKEVEAQFDFPEHNFQSFKSLTLSIYDNTFAIFVADIEIDTKRAPDVFSGPREMEEYLTNYSSRVAAILQRVYVEASLKQLLNVSTSKKYWPVSQNLVRHPNEFIAFDDLRDHPYPRWDAKVPPLLWAHRIFYMPSLTEAEFSSMKSLFRVDEFPQGQTYLMKWGTSYVLDLGRAEKFLEMNVSNQYFYCLLDVLGHSQKRLLRHVVNSKSKINLNSAFQRFDRQQNLIADVESEFLDFMSGLQDINADIFDKIRDSFGTDNLIGVITKRAEMIQQRLERLSERRRSLHQRFLSYILILVGGSQILQLVQNFFWYADEVDGPDGVPGVTDVAQAWSYDLTINVLVLAIAVGAAIYVARIRNR